MLSVVIPAFQAEAHLPRLLRSLDERPDWEVIVVDDGSDDGTRDIARAWLAHRPLGRLLELSHVGPGAARQAGLDAVSGDFVTFADSDDGVVVRVMGDLQVQLEVRGVDVAIAAYDTRPVSTRAFTRSGQGTRPVRAHRVLTGRAAIWGKVYRTLFLRDKGIRFPNLRSADDVIFSWRVASHQPRCVETPDVGYLYWTDPHGQLTRDPEYFRDASHSLEQLWDEARGLPAQSQFLALYAYTTGMAHVARKSTRAAWPQLMRQSVSGLQRGRRTGAGELQP